MATSIHHAILTQVQVDVRALDLVGLNDEDIQLCAIPLPEAKYFKRYPAITISPFGAEIINPKAGTAASDDIGYPVQIALIDSAEQDQQTDLELWLEWREDTVDKFIKNRWAAVSELVQVYEIDVEPGIIIDPAAWLQRNLMVSPFGLRVWYRKQRRI